MSEIIQQWARFEGNVAVEVTAIDPAGRFPHDVQWIDVSGLEAITPNSVRDANGGWTIAPAGDPFVPVEPQPQPQPEAPPPDTRITRLALLNRFLMEERIAIRTKAATDPVVQDFMSLVDAATWIDLGRADTQQGINLLVAKELITASRGAAILNDPIQAYERPSF